MQPQRPLKERLAARPASTYPAQAIRRVQMLSYRKDDPAAIVGSYSFRSQRFPGDIDTMNTVSQLRLHDEWVEARPNDKARLVIAFVVRLQKIVRKVASARNTFYLEVKAGYDWSALNQLHPIGDMHDGVFTPDPSLRGKVTLAASLGWIDRGISAKILGALSSGSAMGAAEYDLISNELRKVYVMRWGADEILAGQKLRAPGAGVKLVQAICAHPTLVKIDVISKVRGMFMELSNIYILRVVKEDGSHEYITSAPSIDGVTFDVEKMLFSPMWYNPFKALKRMFVLARARYLAGYEDYAPFLDAVLSYLSGEEAIWYQLKSEIETIAKMLQDFPAALDAKGRDKPPVYYAVGSQLDGMKTRLASTTIGDSLVETLSHYIDEAIHYLPRMKPQAAECLEKVEKALKGLVKTSAETWLREHKYAPPSSALLPFLPTDEIVETVPQLDPLLMEQHRRTYDWAQSGQPVAAAGYNILAGGNIPFSRDDASARAKLARLLLHIE